MPITRLAFITVAELNEALNESFADDNATALLINEASEKINHELMGRVPYAIAQGLLSTDELNNVKLATAYQAQFIENGYYNNKLEDDCACKDCLSPKAHTYLISTSLWSRWL